MRHKSYINLIGCILFLCILFRIFCDVTYIFRNAGDDRNHMVGIKSEDDLDMVYIGGSAAIVFWQPLRAWNDCGFTSYNLATNTIQAENIRAYMEYAEQYQDPDLYVIGVRAFQYYSDEQNEQGIRNGTDSMDITSVGRYRLLADYFSHRIVDDDTDMVSYYLDIAKYHTNMENLTYNAPWSFMHNRGKSMNKGWEWMDEYESIDMPVDFQTEERAELPDNDKAILRDLLDYCDSLGKDVLFVVCPYGISRQDYEKYNAIKDIIEARGYRFLNTNDYCVEMDVDYSTDFYNVNHMNLFGAKKYTEFLEKYICENYNMPDHRGEEEYLSWDADAERFFKEEKEHAETVSGLISGSHSD